MCIRDSLAISLVVAANFAFDINNRKNLYDEYEDELWDNDDPWEEEEVEWIPDEDLNKEASEEESSEKDWKVVDGDPVPQKILQKGPSEHRVLYSDGSERKVSKDDNIIKYL